MILRFSTNACLLALCLLGSACSCDSESDTRSAKPTLTAPIPTIDRVPPELANKVLARVGERTITLGDYAAVLDRMDRFERLRYQTPERRRALLDELINTELLAREAERLGLHRQPETQAYLNQLLRDEVRRRLRASQPDLSELPEAEVKAYYQANQDEFRDPERRRVAVIAVRSRAQAERMLSELTSSGDAIAWGKAVREHSVLKRGAGNDTLPIDLEGDLGLVSAPGNSRGVNSRVPAAVRAVAFEIPEPGKIAARVVQEGSLYYIVRLVALSPARTRSFEEAETTIRARLLRARLSAAEEELRARLEREVPVSIDEAVVRQIKANAPVDRGQP